MDLPNYFLVDLPDPATLTPSLLGDACSTLKKNRERFLLPRSTESIISVLGTLAAEWLNPGFPFREEALARCAESTGFSTQTVAAGLDRFFRQITRENLLALVAQDLGHVRRLDGFAADDGELQADRQSVARGHDLLVHITGGVLPNPTLFSMMLGLLSRSAQFVKCATSTSFLSRLFAHSLYAIEPKLASCLEVAEWKGGTKPLDAVLFEHASCLTATGTDETLAQIRQQLPPHVRFLGYGHKLSFGFVAREMLSKLHIDAAIDAAADDIAAWDQLGCLSPHNIYVETGGATAPHRFAERLAARLEAMEAAEPRGRFSPESSAAIATRRMFYNVRAAHSDQTRVWQSAESTAWTVIYEEDPSFQTSCLNRFIHIKAVANLTQLYEATVKVHRHLSTIGLSAPPNRMIDLAAELARWGASRICPLGQMQNPPVTWRHDGRPALADLVTWTDLEL